MCTARSLLSVLRLHVPNLFLLAWDLGYFAGRRVRTLVLLSFLSRFAHLQSKKGLARMRVQGACALVSSRHGGGCSATCSWGSLTFGWKGRGAHVCACSTTEVRNAGGVRSMRLENTHRISAFDRCRPQRVRSNHTACEIACTCRAAYAYAHEQTRILTRCYMKKGLERTVSFTRVAFMTR